MQTQALEIEKIVALQNTTLCSLPVQSSILLEQGLPEQLYRVPKGTQLKCVWTRHYEGAYESEKTDGDDYYWMQLTDPLKGSRPLRWFGYKPHWREEHPQPATESFIVSEDVKAQAATIVQKTSEKALREEKKSAQIIADLGPIIELPGAAFTKKRHIYEPVAWVNGKPLPFTWAEFTKGGMRVPATEAIALNIIKIAKVLSHFRIVFAQPIEITSGYRDPYSNRINRGAKFSRHLQGDAADWAPMRDGISQATWEIVKRDMLGGGLAISGVDGSPNLGFFHTDGRGGGNPLKDRRGRTFWTYPSCPWWGREGR